MKVRRGQTDNNERKERKRERKRERKSRKKRIK
jgi:hypothetical protein